MKRMGIMRRRSAVAAVLLGALCTASFSGCAAQAPSSAPTHLEITIRADGNAISAQFLLDCNGANALDSSTLPNAADACKLITDKPEIISSQDDPQAICTEIYGGPEKAEISGKLAGKTISTSFSKHNGCAIERWNRAELLLDQ